MEQAYEDLPLYASTLVTYLSFHPYLQRGHMTSEEILGYIPVRKRIPLRSPYFYALFLTSERMIVAALIDSSLSAASYYNWGPVKRIGAVLSKLRPEQILEDYEGNREISYSDVTKVKMSHWAATTFGKMDVQVHRIEIFTRKKRFRFNICARLDEILERYVPMFRSVLGDRFDHNPEMVKLRFYPFVALARELFNC